MNIIKKDILTVEKGIIVHQVNMQKTMGSGLALQLKTKWPQVYDSYINSPHKLGTVGIVAIDKNLYVANCYGQEFYGRNKDIVYTNYAALESCLWSLNEWKNNYGAYGKDPTIDIYIPYNLGCGLANGDWNIVSQIIDNEIPDAIVCKLEG